LVTPASFLIAEFPLQRSLTLTMNTINRGVWSEDEHDRFLVAIQVYPHGPWRYVAKHVGTRDVRQVQTHAQKYYEKIDRHMRGLRKERRNWVRSEHRIDELPPGLQRPMGSPSTTLHERLYTPSRLPQGNASAAPMPIPTSHQTNEHVTEAWLHTETAHSAPEFSPMMELPTLEESLDMLLEYLSD
jgi:SHAQKYF class myb-like DNA-binding protein